MKKEYLDVEMTVILLQGNVITNSLGENETEEEVWPTP